MIDISWQEATLDRAKCVDFYFVEFAELPNGTYPGQEPGTWFLPTLENLTRGKKANRSIDPQTGVASLRVRVLH